VAKQKKIVTAEKNIYTVGYLRSVSSHALEEARANEAGSYFNLMIALVFSAFTIEAYLNHLGARIIPFWSKMERNLSPSKKLEILAIQLGLPIDFGKRPFQSVKSIFQLRDSLAHGKTEHLMEESIQILDDREKPELPKAEWQKQVTLDIVQRYFDDTGEIVECLHGASGLEFNPLHIPETASWKVSRPAGESDF
jgi:hypothetical protein